MDVAAWLRREEETNRGLQSVHECCGRAGDYRSCHPEETLARVMPLLPRYGVTRLGRLTGLDRIGIPVWNAVRPNSLTIAISQGKGVTDAHAKASAAMEAIERAVAGEPEVPSLRVPAASLGASGFPLPQLLAPGAQEIAGDEPVEWVEGYDLIRRVPAWAPVEAVKLDRTRPSRFWQSSDGLASGNDLTEAVLHGLLERVERDAEVLWNLTDRAGRHAACVDPSSLGDGTLSDLCEMIASADLELRLFDMTSDVGVPAFTALVAERTAQGRGHARLVEVANGSGAHPSAARAAIRAVTEAAQSRLTYISGARDDIPPEAFSRPLPETTREDLEAAPRIAVPARPEPPHEAAAMLQAVLARLDAAGARSAVAVPLVGPGRHFAVAKLLVPDLEHPDGARRTRFGRRAVARMLAT